MSTVIYVAIVEGDQDAGYSAFFPDLPGCVTAAETMLELPAAARDALSLHLQGMAEDGDVFPEPTPIEAVRQTDPEVKEVGRILVDADVEDTPVRVNISIGGQFLKRLDIAAEARGMTRSGFLVEAARAAITNEDRQADISARWDALTAAAANAGDPTNLCMATLASGIEARAASNLMAAREPAWGGWTALHDIPRAKSGAKHTLSDLSISTHLLAGGVVLPGNTNRVVGGIVAGRKKA